MNFVLPLVRRPTPSTSRSLPTIVQLLLSAQQSRPIFTMTEKGNKRIISRYLEESHEQIFENNRKWVESKKATDAQFFDKLAAGQNPDYL